MTEQQQTSKMSIIPQKINNSMNQLNQLQVNQIQIQNQNFSGNTNVNYHANPMSYPMNHNQNYINRDPNLQINHQNPTMVNSFHQQNFKNQQNYQINLNLQQQFVTNPMINYSNIQRPQDLLINKPNNEIKPKDDISKITGSLNIQAREFVPKKKLNQEPIQKITQIPISNNPPVANNISFAFYNNQVENVFGF